MARVLTAYLKRANVPERAALQAAIAALEFPLTLDDMYVPFETAGYLPCTLDGEDAGFDLRFKDATAELPPALQSKIGDRDTAMACKWGGDPREEVAALVVCAALAKAFDALVRQGDSKTLLPCEQLVAKAKAAGL
jgi:hypothetical protein